MTCSSELQEVRRLHELNVELMDTLLVIGQRLIRYIDRYGILVEHRDSLALLVGRVQSILLEISRPYNRNPVLSDANLQGKRSDEDLTGPPSRLCYVGG
jgi:hypothetical protein